MSAELSITLPAHLVEEIAHRVATIVVVAMSVKMTGNGRVQLLTMGEAAALLSVHKRTVSRLVERGDLHAYDIAGGPRLRLTDVEEYIQSSKREPRSVSARPSSKRERSPAADSSGLSFADRLRCPKSQ
jgi:excisionase family DNA binding protein